MNNDIKEILGKLEDNKDNVYYVGYVDGVNIDNELMPKDIKILLDYITKLQKEIEKLKGQLEEKIYLYNKLSTESKYIIDKLESRQ